MADTPTDENREETSSEFQTGECTLTPPWGKVRLTISSDAMQVVVTEVAGDSSLCPSLTPETVSVFLHENGINNGVLFESLQELVDCLAADPEWGGSLVVAEGRPPMIPGRAEYTMFKGAKDVQVVGNDALSVDGELLVFPAIKDYLDQQRNPGDMPEVIAKVVGGGEILVTKTQPFKGRPGRDVFGRAVAPPAFVEVIQGDNVELVGNNVKFTASFFGYLHLIGRRISVLSPIVVADDNMTAWYVQFEQLPETKTPFVLDLTVLLNNAGLKKETDGAQIEELCLQLGQGGNSGWYVAARGQEAVNGQDGALLFEGTDPPSALRDDGSIDFKVINLVKTVEADQHFATLSMPTEGIPGYTLLDEELPAESGQSLRVDVKGNVRAEEGEEGEVRYYSETEGVIQYQNGKLEIDPLYHVKGNVDFSTGNIDVDCCLTVAGNVCSDFTVKSTKDIIIKGTVEPGAKIIVDGNLQVKGGIIGENTEVMVLGNLQAEYVQDAKIVVKGQVLINQYAFSSVIRSVGSIQVGPGTGERGGSVVGGIICSSARIEAKSTGSPSNVLTAVVVEPAPHKLAKFKQLKEQIEECEVNVTKIMRTLDLDAIEPDLVKQHLEKANPKQRELYLQILSKLNLLVKQQHGLAADKKKLREELWQDVDKMSILVRNAFYSNTKVRIARKEFHNRIDKGRTHIIHDGKKLCIDSSKGAGDELPE